jgi:hypothetical protein
MISPRNRKLARKLIILAVIAGGLWVILGLTNLTSAPKSSLHADMGKPVLAGFSQARSEASRIRFTLADESYTLARTADGWVMEDAGGYPIRPERLAELATGLETLSYGEKRTNDPYKHNRIGLGDPTEDGNGALVEVFGPDGDITSALIAGRKNDTIYVRRPDDNQTYRANGTLPPFYTSRSWLDFDIINIGPTAIRSVRITDNQGESVYLSRQAGSDTRSFRPAPPYQDDTLISRLAASTTALAVTRLSALDVKPAADITTRRVGHHISETFDGLEIDLSAYREPDGLWVTFRAIEAGEGARRAEAINTKAEGWAYRVTDYDFQDFTPAVSSLIERASE